MSFTGDAEKDNFTTNGKEWNRLQRFFPEDKKIWAPFYCDGKQKEHFKEMGYDIIHEDEDFFENNKGDIVIDNPPFTKKKEVLLRLKELEKPFMLILPPVCLGYKYFQENFKDIQIIIPKSRIKFTQLGKTNTNYTPPFGSFVFCWSMNLAKDITFIE